jgi:hypothetical protein
MDIPYASNRHPTTYVGSTCYRTRRNKVEYLGSRSEASAGTAARTCCWPPLLLLGHSEAHPAADGTGHSELLSARRLGNHPHILPEIFSFSYIHPVPGTFIPIHSPFSSLLVRSEGKTSLGCRAGIRTRACHTGGQRTTR